jgi:hypothetical protein
MSERQHKGRILESYIVRVYGRLQGDPESLVGVVEFVSGGAQHAFRGIAELSSLLLAEPDQSAGQRKNY